MAVQSTQVSETSRVRRRLVVAAVLLTLFAALHHADHVIRGHLVVANGLDPDWNHSGWPFRAQVTPFTASLGVYLILLGGIILTLRGRVGAAYWLVSAIVLGAIISVVHFLPGEKTETPRVIYRSHESAVAGVLALIDLVTIVVALLALGVQAVRLRGISGRW